MKEEIDLYYTIAKPVHQTIFKEKKSKFLGYAFPIQNEDELKPLIEKLKIKHPRANHVCYAWQIGITDPRFRVNDDGEPNNSAGMPIYGQIQSFGVTNILVAVVRIFGGAKLGIGGLISAYRVSAQITLQASDIVKRILMAEVSLTFNYPEMEKVMRIIKQNSLDIIRQKMEFTCSLTILVRKTDLIKIIELFDRIQNVGVSSRII